MSKPVIIMLGKLPPPYMGPSIATEIILKSSLRNSFDLIHLDTKAYDSLNEFGKWSFKKINKNLSKYAELRRLIRKHKPGLVWIPISQTTAGFLKDSVYIWIAASAKCKVVLHLRGSNFSNWIESASQLTKYFVKTTMKKCSAVIVLGEKLRPIFKDYFKEEMIFVVPNGADYKIPLIQRKDEGIVKLLYIANLQATKGIEDVINAIIHLNNTHEGRFRLDVIGDWRSEAIKATCEALISKNRLPVTVFTPEMKPDKLKFLSESDIFVFTPRAPEGHPWVIVEAMATGLPIVSTDQGAITESVIHERNGYIVNTPDSTQIASILKKLIENPELRQRMGKESRKHYLEGFTEEKMVERLTETFNRILQQ